MDAILSAILAGGCGLAVGAIMGLIAGWRFAEQKAARRMAPARPLPVPLTPLYFRDQDDLSRFMSAQYRLTPTPRRR